jgi:Zn-dependent protease with chaperone function
MFSRVGEFFGNYYVARGIRAVRVGVLCFAIYGAGYRSGVTDFIEDPVEMHETLLKTVISQSGGIKVVDKSDPESKRVQMIGRRIIEAAKHYCDEQLVVAKAANAEAANNQADIDYWEAAIKRLCGQWSISYLDAPTPNAFVSNLLPRHIFVHQGLVREIQPSDEELALIMAHEISHLIHNHSQNLSILKGALAAMQLISFVFVDPTGGLWFYFFDYAFSNLENYYYASFSRETEKEADMTGVQIAAMACYETRGASKVFLRFSEYSGADSSSWSWADSHPSDSSREEYLSKESEHHNPEKHGAKCHQVSQYLQLFKRKVLEHEASSHPMPMPSEHRPLLTEDDHSSEGGSSLLAGAALKPVSHGADSEEEGKTA